jgi:hypothetical protein
MDQSKIASSDLLSIQAVKLVWEAESQCGRPESATIQHMRSASSGLILLLSTHAY